MYVTLANDFIHGVLIIILVIATIYNDIYNYIMTYFDHLKFHIIIQVATLLHKDNKGCRALVNLSDAEDSSSSLNLDFDDICQFIGTATQ